MMTLMQKYTVQRWINIYNHYVCAYNEINSPKTTINTPDENVVVNHKKEENADVHMIEFSLLETKCNIHLTCNQNKLSSAFLKIKPKSTTCQNVNQEGKQFRVLHELGDKMQPGVWVHSDPLNGFNFILWGQI